MSALHKGLAGLCSLLSASALFAIMALTFFDVGGRKLLDNSIPGSFELTELLMVAVIFGALPLVSMRGEHVVFDSLDAVLPPFVRRTQDLLVNLLCASAMLGLAWLMWQTGGQFAESGETTAQIKIPKYPFLYGMAAMCAVCGMLHLSLIAQRRGASNEQAESAGTAL